MTSNNDISSRPSQLVSGKQNRPPNQTLFVNNLPDKIAKPDAIRVLYLIFSMHGHVLDIVLTKAKKARGQVHVVFKDGFAATQAMRALQGHEFCGKSIRIDYAKGKSRVVTMLDGSAMVPEAAKRQQEAVSDQKSTGATDLQKTIFSGQAAINAGTSKTSLSLSDGPTNNPSPQGIKRPREDASDDEDTPMDMEDDGEAMDVSDDD